MIDIDKLTVGELKEITKAAGFCAKPKPSTKVPLPFGVGDAILVRTVTMIQLGRVKAIGRDFLVLEDGGWIADTGRFSDCLAKGTLGEFERADVEWFLVGRGAIVDAFPWKHALPKASK